MGILAAILCLTGVVLFITGGKITQYTPPNYQSEDDFAELLRTMGKLVKGAACVLFAAGIVCLILAV